MWELCISHKHELLQWYCKVFFLILYSVYILFPIENPGHLPWGKPAMTAALPSLTNRQTQVKYLQNFARESFHWAVGSLPVAHGTFVFSASSRQNTATP